MSEKIFDAKLDELKRQKDYLQRECGLLKTGGYPSLEKRIDHLVVMLSLIDEELDDLTKKIKSNKAPEPIGPYSQAIEVNGMIFTSGQIAINPWTGRLTEGDVREQAKMVFENLRAVLEAAGSSLERAVKTTIYLKNMDDFGDVNEVYGGYFGTALPARSTVEVSRLPKDVLIEVDCVAVKA